MHPAWVLLRRGRNAGQMKENVVSGFFGSLHPRHISRLRKEAVASTHRTGRFCRQACFSNSHSLHTTHALPFICITARKTRSTVLDPKSIAFREARLLWATLHGHSLLATSLAKFEVARSCLPSVTRCDC